MALSDGTYYIDSRESTDICAVGSNETYETIRTLPDSHSPQPVGLPLKHPALYPDVDVVS